VDITLQLLAVAPTHELLDAEKAERRLRVGDVIGVHETARYATLQADGSYAWNEPISNPKYVLVHIKGTPATSVEQAREYMKEWRTDPQANIESHDAVNDVYVARVRNLTLGVAAEGAVRPADLAKLADLWDVTGTLDGNDVLATLDVWAMLQSAGFWGIDIPAGVALSHVYSQAQGGHRVTVDYTARPDLSAKADVIERRATRWGALVVSHATGVLRFDIASLDVIKAFRAEMWLFTNRLVLRHRYRIDPASLPATIRNALIADREVTVTWTQARPYLVDAVTRAGVV